MSKNLTTLLGGALVALGILALATNLALFEFWPWNMSSVVHLWPLTIITIGLTFAAVPVVVRGERWPGAMFIPAMPIIFTGMILLFTTLTRWSHAWSWLWPLELLGLTLGFVFAGLYMRIFWFSIPAVILGLNWAVFQFCALTGLWHLWSVLWTVEPLAVGIVLLLVGYRVHSKPVIFVGYAGCALAGTGAIAMLALDLRLWWLSGAFGSLLLIAAGAAMLLWPALRAARPPAQPAVPAQGTNLR